MKTFLTLKEVLKLAGLSSKEKIKKLVEKKLIEIEKINGKDFIHSKYIDFISNYYKESHISEIVSSNISFRAANLSDLIYIKNLLTIGVHKGHYKETLIANEDIFNQTILALINGTKDLRREAIPQTAICYYQSEKIGFITMASMPGGIVEFWYLSIEEKYQNKGYGTKVIVELENMYYSLETKDYPIFLARCSNCSQSMIHIFEKLGYLKRDAEEKNWYILAKSKDLNFKKILKF